MLDDKKYMTMLFKLAQVNNQPFVTLIVNNATGIVLAIGINKGVHDLTQHSEMLAIENLQKTYPIPIKTGMTVYSTAEPCPMCAGALVYCDRDYGCINEVVYSLSREKLVSMGWTEFDGCSSEKMVFKHEVGHHISQRACVMEDHSITLFRSYAPQTTMGETAAA